MLSQFLQIKCFPCCCHRIVERMPRLWEGCQDNDGNDAIPLEGSRLDDTSLDMDDSTFSF